MSPDEEEFEPSYGLPESLPAGERLLWQGSPAWRSVARHVLHLRALSVYFGAMLAWRGATLIADGATLRTTATSLGTLLAMALAAIGVLTLIAWLTERTTVYTVTDRRVVMRIGIVLSITFNLPLRTIEAAGLKLHAGGSGDITLRLAGPDRIAFAHLWPHARPWRVARAEPMLRALPDAERIAGLLASALAASAASNATSADETASPVPATTDRPLDRPAAGAAPVRPSAIAPDRQALAA